MLLKRLTDSEMCIVSVVVISVIGGGGSDDGDNLLCWNFFFNISTFQDVRIR